MTTRRSFIQQAGLITAGILVNPATLLSKPNKKVGIQLYSLRNQLVKDLKGTLSKVAEIGFCEVETYGYTKAAGFWGLNIKEFNELLKQLNLKSPSGHYDFNSYFLDGKEDDLKSYIEAAHETGQKYVTVPNLSGRLRGSLDGFKSVAEKLNKASELTKKAGLQLAYHNHAFEFEDFNGKSGYDVLLSQTSPENVKFELDIYWAVRGGKDPIRLFKQNPGRFHMWHVKDMSKNDTSFTEVGTGRINYTQIFSEAKLAGVKHYFVEQDVIKIDPFESIKQSHRYIKNTLL